MPLSLTVDRSSPEPLYRQVERQLRQLIETRRLVPGERVPSVRELAGQLEVGRLTIATAYEQLAADGYLEGRVGFGTVVVPAAPEATGSRDVPADVALPRRRPSPAGSVKLPPIDAPIADASPADPPGAAPRFDLRPGALGGAGVAVGPALERLLREAWRDIGDGGPTLPDPSGDPLLRAAIAAHVRTTRGSRCGPEQIIVLSGALIGVAAVARLWLAGGRVAAVEDPGDADLRRALELGGGALVPVASDRHGVLVEHLPPETSVVLVSPTVQAATGARMPLARRLRLLEWAAAAGSVVLEDARFDELVLEMPVGPSLQGLDDDGRVIHLGGFESILHPGVRVAYAIVPAALVTPIRATLAALDPGATPVQQRALGRFLADGHLDRHLVRVRRALADRHAVAVDTLRRELGWLVTAEPPTGGTRLVATIEDEAWTASRLAEASLAAGVGLVPLSRSDPGGSPSRDVVIDVGRHEPAEIREAIRLVAAALSAARAHPAAAVARARRRSTPRPAASSRWPARGRPPLASTSGLALSGRRAEAR